MNSFKPKFRLFAPMDKNGVIIPLSITEESPGIIQISHYPDYSVSGFIFVFMLVLTILFISFGSSYAFFSGVFLLASIYELAIRRSIQCKIDINAGTIHYKHDGSFGLPVNAQEISQSTERIIGLEMQQHIQRWGDTFHINLVLQDNVKLILSPSNLRLGECQEYAEKIKELLHLNIPIKAID